MRVFDFNRAIVRQPGQSVVQGIRSDPDAEPTFVGVREEHRAYFTALRDAGLVIDVLPALEAFPDSMFVEDPALTFAEGAILLRPGAPSRVGEREEMRPVLHRHFKRVLELGENEYVDGGDVLVTPRSVFIGLSKRTTPAGAEALSARLAKLGHEARIVATPHGVLHLKTASSLVSDGMVLVTPAMAESGIFAGFEILLTPDGEEAAANALRVNDLVLVGAHYSRTIEMLRDKGLSVRPLSIREVAKLDAGLSCMSLRW
jgi:dimethylargininase